MSWDLCKVLTWCVRADAAPEKAAFEILQHQALLQRPSQVRIRLWLHKLSEQVRTVPLFPFQTVPGALNTANIRPSHSSPQHSSAQPRFRPWLFRYLLAAYRACWT
jgi:hypothetical protein